jgi:hypothetical protein
MKAAGGISDARQDFVFLTHFYIWIWVSLFRQTPQASAVLILK